MLTLYAIRSSTDKPKNRSNSRIAFKSLFMRKICDLIMRNLLNRPNNFNDMTWIRRIVPIWTNILFTKWRMCGNPLKAMDYSSLNGKSWFDIQGWQLASLVLDRWIVYVRSALALFRLLLPRLLAPATTSSRDHSTPWRSDVHKPLAGNRLERLVQLQVTLSDQNKLSMAEFHVFSMEYS